MAHLDVLHPWMFVFLGVLLPVAYIWAYTNPRWRDEPSSDKDPIREDETT